MQSAQMSCPIQQPNELTRARIRVRPYRAHDLQAVRRICADTGFLGKPIDPVFEDRELFADYLTGYYTRFEAEALLVCEVEGEVRGYLMGCRLPMLKQSYQFRQHRRRGEGALSLLPPALQQGFACLSHLGADE